MGATTKWVSWHAAIYQYRSSDDVNYRAMAEAAPGLLHHRIPEWHAERFAVDWIVGVTAKVLGFGVVTSFRVWVILTILITCLVLAELLVRIGLSLPAAIVCMAVFVLNAYELRPVLLAPGGLGDVVFVLGTTIAVRGLVLRSPASLLGGLLLATVARQTALPPAAVAAVAVALDPAWRARLGGRQLPFAALTIGLPLALYAVIRVVSHPFAGPPPSLHAMTLLGASLSVGTLGQHFARCVNVLLSVGALLLAAWWLLRTTPRDAAARARGVPGAGLPGAGLPGAGLPGTAAARNACLAFGLAIVLQPVVMNPAWASYNENRLSVIGLIPFVVALALMLADLEHARARALSIRAAAIAVGLLALASFHHISTVVGTANKGQTLMLEVIVAVALLFGVVRSFGSAPVRRPTVRPAAADGTQH
jgi:hypothetical protein